MSKYLENIENMKIKQPSYMMALPNNKSIESIYDKALVNNNFNFELFSELILDEALDNLKLSKEFIFLKLEKNKLNFRQLSIKYKETNYTVSLYLDDFNLNNLINKTHLLDSEIEQLETSKFGVVTEIMFTNDVMDSYLFQLKLINSLFENICAIADLSSASLCSGKWLSRTCKSSVAPNPSFLYTLQAINNDNNEVWIHSHGLLRCNLYELELLNLNIENYNICSNILTYLVLLLLSDANDELSPIHLGSDIVVTLLDHKLARLRYTSLLGTDPEDKLNHSDYYMTIYAYLSEDDFNNGILSEITELLPRLDNPVFFVSTSNTLRMSNLAKDFFEGFLNIASLDGNFPSIKAGIEVDEEYKDDDNSREHLWFNFIEYDPQNNEIKGILQNEPYYIKDLSVNDEVIFKFEELTDWIVYTNERAYTPDNIYLID